MKKVIQLAYYLTLLLLLSVGSGCTKAARQSRVIARADNDFEAGRYERAEIGYRTALRLGGPESASVGELFSKLGRVYHAQGRWLDAVAHLNASLERRTNDVSSKALLSESLFFSGSWPQAFAESEAVLQMQPGHPEAMSLLVDSSRLDGSLMTKAAAILELQPESAKKTAAYRTAQGTLLLQSGKLDAAEKEYQAALEQDPKYFRAHLRLAHLQKSRKDLERAKAEARAAIAALPDRSGAVSECLETLYFLGEKEEAKRVAGDETRKIPDFIPPYLFLASKALDEGRALQEGEALRNQRYDDSLAFLKTALVKDPANFNALALCGDVFLARNDGTNALRYYQQATSRFKTAPASMLVKMGYANVAINDLVNAKARFREALDANTNSVYPEAALALSALVINHRPPDARAARELTPKLTKLTIQEPKLLGGYIQLADLYVLQSDFDNAIKVTQTAQERFPEVPELPYRLGSLYSAVKQNVEARKSFEQALGLATNNLMFLSALISHDLKNDRYDDAYNLISRSVKDRPDLAPLHYIQGVVLRQGSNILGDGAGAVKTERIDGAIASFRKAIELAPTNQEPYFALAQLYKDAGRQRDALRELQEYLGKTNSPSAHLLAAQIHEQLKDYPKAAEEYEKVLATNERSFFTLVALNNLACAYNDHLGKVEEAYVLAQRAREMAPRSTSIADTLGWAAFRKGDYSRALTLLQEAAADKDLATKPDFLYHFAMANYMAGEEEIAREAFRQALTGAEEKANARKTGSVTNAAPEAMPAWTEDVKSKLSNLSLNASVADSGLEPELKKRLSAAPSDPVLLRRLGMVQERRGDYQAANTSYEEALKLNPKHTGIRLQIAMLYAGPMNDLARGLELAKQVRSAAPNDPEAIRVVGQLAYRSGDYRLAVALLEESARNYPDDSSLNYYLGAARYSVGRLADAEQAMRKAAESHVADAEQFLLFTSAAKEPGKHPKVVESALETLAKGSNNLPAMMLVAVDNESRRENYSKAVEMYSRILKGYPMFYPASRNLGLLYFSNLQDRTNAYELLNKVREQYSEDAVFSRALGILAAQRGDYARAAQLLQSNAEGQLDDPDALFYLGKAQLKLKRPADARRTLERALQGNLTKELDEEARKLLGSLK